MALRTITPSCNIEDQPHEGNSHQQQCMLTFSDSMNTVTDNANLSLGSNRFNCLGNCFFVQLTLCIDKTDALALHLPFPFSTTAGLAVATADLGLLFHWL